MENRYSRITDVLDIIMLMEEVRPSGITLNNIKDKLGVSHKTAERIRDCLLLVEGCPFGEIETGTKEKYWGILCNNSFASLINISTEELSVLENLRKDSKNSEFKEKLDKIINKIKTCSSYKQNRSNTELLLQNEGIAVRQGVSCQINSEYLKIFRQAIKNNLKINCEYKNKNEEIKNHILNPLGIIFGERNYLVAKKDDKENVATYYLHKFLDVKITKEKFERGDFNLQVFVGKSFGGYHGGKVFDVKLQFDGWFVDEVMNYDFHPTQKKIVQKDGSIIVTFQASGDLEIIWNLCRWGQCVKVLAPEELKQNHINWLQESLNVYNR